MTERVKKFDREPKIHRIKNNKARGGAKNMTREIFDDDENYSDLLLPETDNEQPSQT